MKLIPLTKGKFAQVDDGDFGWLTQWKWYAGKSQAGIWYAARGRPGGGGLLYMHNVITGHKMTDHKDGDGLNNQRDNLRETSPALNTINSRKRAGMSSRYKGVYWCKTTRRWRADYTNRAGKGVYVGRFDTELDAALAVDLRVAEEYGDLAVYNLPRPGQRSAITGQMAPPT